MIRIYYLAKDTETGFDISHFATQEQLDAARIRLIDTSDAGKYYTEIQACLAAGQLEEAWEVWRDKLCDHQDSYWFGESHIEIKEAS